MKSIESIELTRNLKAELYKLGADIVGFGNLSELSANIRENLPIGICVALKYPKETICGISELPTKEYLEQYNLLNERLDKMVTQAAEILQNQNYKAVAQTRSKVGFGDTDNNTILPHKTVATRAGVGWIGKCAMLVTEQYGSMIRISSILTDAPLVTAEPINQPKCGECTKCTTDCPAKAVSGKLWEPHLARDDFFDPVKCRETAKERSLKGFGGEITLCGKCMEVCPWTRKYLA